MTEHMTGLEKGQQHVVSLDEFLKHARPQPQTLEVPELGHGNIIKIKPLTLSDREKMLSACTDTRTGKLDNTAFQAMTLLLGVVEPKFSPEHVAALKDASLGVVDKVARAIWAISGLQLSEEALKNASRATAGGATS